MKNRNLYCPEYAYSEFREAFLLDKYGHRKKPHNFKTHVKPTTRRASGPNKPNRDRRTSGEKQAEMSAKLVHLKSAMHEVRIQWKKQKDHAEHQAIARRKYGVHLA